MSSKSYAAATAAYAPAPAAQPDHAFLDSLQPANRKMDANHRNSHLDAEHSDDDDQEEAAMGSDKPGASFKATLEGHPAMEDRPVAEEVDHIELTEPYVPRANIAATPEHPDGTVEGGWAKKHEHESVLQQHVHWWDPDHDGVIWPWDTFSGFHQLGFALFWCILSVFIIHPGFSWFTNESWIPNPLMPINVKHIHRAKHGSDAGVYDNAGRFVPARFEALFAKFGGDKGGITFWDGLRMLRANRNIADPVGWTGAFFELVATYLLIWPKDGIMTKEDWRVVYDGSIFPVVAARERERVESARRSSLFFRLFALLPLSGWFKENRAQSEEEVRKDDKDVDGKGSVWLEQKYRGRY